MLLEGPQNFPVSLLLSSPFVAASSSFSPRGGKFSIAWHESATDPPLQICFKCLLFKCCLDYFHSTDFRCLYVLTHAESKIWRMLFPTVPQHATFQMQIPELSIHKTDWFSHATRILSLLSVPLVSGTLVSASALGRGATPIAVARMACTAKSIEVRQLLLNEGVSALSGQDKNTSFRLSCSAPCEDGRYKQPAVRLSRGCSLERISAVYFLVCIHIFYFLIHSAGHSSVLTFFQNALLGYCSSNRLCRSTSHVRYGFGSPGLHDHVHANGRACRNVRPWHGSDEHKPAHSSGRVRVQQQLLRCHCRRWTLPELLDASKGHELWFVSPLT